MKYLRLLRLQDQYVEVCAVLTAAIFVREHNPEVLLWAVAAVLLSVPAYIINEIVDFRDSDRYSWNTGTHIRRGDRLNRRIVVVMSSVISVAGIILSWYLGLFWWGIAIWTIGELYSLEPIRLKRRVVFDIAGQLLPFWILPFLAVAWGRGNADLTLVLLLLTVSAIVSMLMPYQVSDIEADRKAGLTGTHVALGMKNTLVFGFMAGIFALFTFAVFGVYRWAPWVIPCLLFAPVTLWLYFRWLRETSPSAVFADIRYWVGILKPLTQLSVPYLLFVWYAF